MARTALAGNPIVAPTATQLGNLNTALSMRTTVDFNRMSILRRLADDRSSEVNAAHQVQILDPAYPVADDAVRKVPASAADDYNTPNQRDSANFSKWPDGKYPTSENILLKVDRKIQGATKLKYLDSVETPLNYLERQRAKLSAQMAVDMEDDYWEFLQQDSLYTTGLGTRDDLGKAKLTMTSGVATDGKPVVSGSAGFKAVYDAFWDFNVWMANNNISGPTTGATIGGGPGMPYAAMAPEVFKEFAKWFLEQKYSWDLLTEDVIRNNSILQSGSFRGMVGGIPILVTPACKKPTADHADNPWVIQMGTTMANSVAMRPLLTQYLTPQMNQTDTDYKLRQIGFHGRVAVNKTLNYQVRIPTA